MPVPPCFIGSAARFDTYRNNVETSLIGALADIYPVVKQLVGGDFFNGVASAYIRKNRPASPVLSEYGYAFGAFIDTFEPAASLPYLGDVARLERAWLDAYHAEDIAPLKIQALGDLSQSALERLTFKLHPSAALVTSSHPVVTIWRRHQGDAYPDLGNIEWVPEHALIVRPGLDVHVQAIPQAAFDFFTRLAGGETLSSVCDALANDAGFDPSAHLANLFGCGAVAALDPGTTYRGN
ncbi:MAG: putative DNA-binding domain-containing protein [Rhodospirillales bacterium]|nr:putative DNA-binding domain-containing protein [Rhodospirillales bacterium]MBO6785209.1 putative DNA-binding domain-containing protein [Rhodospirillales bacterium]